MTRFRCDQYPFLRVSRSDGTAVTFANGIATVDDESDAELLRGFDFIVEDDTPPEVVAQQERTPSGGLPPGVLWHSPVLGVADGYGNSAMQLMLHLDGTERITIEPGFAVSGDLPVADIASRPRVVSDVYVAYCPPTRGSWRRRQPKQAVLGFTMWEDDRIPDCWEDAVREADAVATCSRANVAMLEQFMAKHHIKAPICYVPLGVNGDLYPFKKREYQPGNDTFTVLHTSTCMNDERKGAREAYFAFVDAFGDRQDVKLIFRAKFGMLTEAAHDKRVEFRTGQITDAQKSDLLQQAHCFLYPSFGEGFGLMPLEAVASGLPTICADNTAMHDYIDLVHAVRCDPEPSKISTPFQAQSQGNWMRPRHEDLVVQLRALESEYPRAADQAAKAAKEVRKRWTYQRSAAALAQAIDVARKAFSSK